MPVRSDTSRGARPAAGAGAASVWRARHRVAGASLIELLFAIAVTAALAATTVPLSSSLLDALRAMAAARYVEGRIMSARMEAVRRAANVGLRFWPVSGDHEVGLYVDGNQNGVRAVEIRRGIDRPLVVPERLRDRFPGTTFGIVEGVPDLDGGTGGKDGIRLGGSDLLSAAPNGTTTAGTVYVRGKRDQYAVRVLGATGRTRVFQYHTGKRSWIAR